MKINWGNRQHKRTKLFWKQARVTRCKRAAFTNTEQGEALNILLMTNKINTVAYVPPNVVVVAQPSVRFVGVAPVDDVNRMALCE